ncbi:MAG: IMP dehydrogenase [Byssovorax sp.]
MRREPKRARPERAVGSVISRRSASSSAAAAATTRTRSTSGAAGASAPAEPHASLWLDALDPDAPAPAAQPTLAAAVALPLFLAALIVFALAKSSALRVLVPLALAAAAGLILARVRAPARRGWLRWGRKPSSGLTSGQGRGPRRGLELEGDRLSFRSAGRLQALLSTSSPFGVTLLATPRRERAVLLLTSASGTFYVGAHFDVDARRAAAHVLDRATTVGGDDVGLESIAPDGDPLLIAPEDFVTLLDTLAARSPSCLDRFVLTDARGADLTLDGRALLAGERSIDLDAPLEWRAIVFQEAFGQSVAVYQGTWVRQGDSEIVLVCLLPSLGPAIFADIDLAGLDRTPGQSPKAPLSGLLRDIRLMQATPEPPPPTEQRVAIDRHFMLPVRCALDRAPRAAQQQPNRARA